MTPKQQLKSFIDAINAYNKVNNIKQSKFKLISKAYSTYPNTISIGNCLSEGQVPLYYWQVEISNTNTILLRSEKAFAYIVKDAKEMETALINMMIREIVLYGYTAILQQQKK